MFKKYSVLFTIIFPIGSIFILYNLGYRWNHSTSYPKGIYQLTVKNKYYQKGQLVLFCPPNNSALQLALKRKYLRNGMCNGGFEPVIKKIYGIENDKISFKNSIITINSLHIPDTKILAYDIHNRPLPKLNNFTVPKKFYFLLSDHQPKISFDSRYYGAVPIENIKGIIIPIYLF